MISVIKYSCIFWPLFVAASGEPPLFLAASVHCATRNAIAAARKDIHCSVSGSSSPSFFELEVPAIMPVVKEMCGLDNVEKYLKTLVGPK
jgi:abscisic-aldehyde oxidase